MQVNSMKIELIGSPEIIMSNPYSKHNYFGWPSVIKASDSKIIVGASGFRLGHICPFGKGVIAYSFDEGQTFTSPVPIIDTVLDDRDVGLCSFGKNGIIVTSFNNTRKMQRYHVQGENELRVNYTNSYLDTISEEEEKVCIGSNFRISNDGGITFGSIFKSPVTSPHGPVELADGTVLWVGSNFYENNNVDDDYVCINAYKINTDDGSMEFLGRVPDIFENGELLMPCEPFAVELSDGAILCHIRTEQNFTTYQSISYDKGKTWTEPEKLLDDFGGAPCHILKHSSGVLVSLYGYRQKPYEIRAMFSSDSGKTWDINHTLYVNGISGDLGYPATVELNDYSLLTVFYAKASEDSPCVIMKQHWKILSD